MPRYNFLFQFQFNNINFLLFYFEQKKIIDFKILKDYLLPIHNLKKNATKRIISHKNNNSTKKQKTKNKKAPR